ncbi:hypothetical protein [Neobacillus sp. LXY-1]|uniref:hypothetical protein n=1 Tax=Neobacillus sp. LXY-1 TaxID=3379133 RepID=UPI003EDFC83B
MKDLITGEGLGSISFSSNIRDISERKQAEEKIMKLCIMDPLTRFSNRFLLNDRLTQAIDQVDESAEHRNYVY